MTVFARDRAPLNVSYEASARALQETSTRPSSPIAKAKTGETVAVNQSAWRLRGKQAMSVAAGLDADVITMNQAPDI